MEWLVKAIVKVHPNMSYRHGLDGRHYLCERHAVSPLSLSGRKMDIGVPEFLELSPTEAIKVVDLWLKISK